MKNYILKTICIDYIQVMFFSKSSEFVPWIFFMLLEFFFHILHLIFWFLFPDELLSLTAI